MEESNQLPKRRRSNFDITPEQLTSTSDQFGDLNSFLLSSSASVIQHTNVFGSESFAHISVVDRTFLRKLENALVKNFEYIDRKDLLIAEALVRGEVYVEQSKLSKSVPSSSFGKYSFVSTKPGIGSAIGTASGNDVSKAAPAKVEPVSVYVSGLPKDITEEELEILFSPQGKIKKIKIYADENGQKKGDALITYASPDSATTACFKLHKLNIGDGHILSVTKAEFANKPISSSTQSADHNHKESNHIITTNTTMEKEDPEIMIANAFSDEEIRRQLPIECEAETHAVLIFWKSFLVDIQDANEVETEYLLACCPFGNVEIIQLLPLLSDVFAANNHTSAVSIYSIVVTFEDPIAAKKCQAYLQGKELVGNKVSCRLILPRNVMLPMEKTNDTNIIPSLSSIDQPEPPSLTEASAVLVQDIISSMQIEAQITSEHVQGLPLPHDDADEIQHDPTEQNLMTTEEYDHERIQQDVDSVEDFLNSLL